MAKDIDRAASKHGSSGWSPSLAELTCTEAAVMIIGGEGDEHKSVLTEVYAPGLSMILPKMKFDILGPAVNYVDGHLLLCGGHYKATKDQSRHCYKFQPKGNMVQYIYSIIKQN